MKIKKAIIIAAALPALILLLTACSASIDQTATARSLLTVQKQKLSVKSANDTKKSEDGLTQVYSQQGSLNKDMPEWIFSLYGKDVTEYGYTDMVIRIYDENGNILIEDTLPDIYNKLSDAHIILEDANFDGYKDVWYSEGAVGAHQHYWYRLLAWDEEEGGFWLAEDFENICNPVADARDEVIRSLGAASAFTDIYTVYIYEDKSFRIDMELALTYDEIDNQESRLYEVCSFDTGEPVLVNSFDCIGPPDPNHPEESDFWGPDSIWKLDDPIWRESRHFRNDISDSSKNTANAHYFVRAWNDFITPAGGAIVRNYRYLFVDLDDDGKDEMLAYKELWEPPVTNIWFVTPYICVFDIENGKEINVSMEIETYDLFNSTLIFINPLNKIIVSEYAGEGYYEYVICTYKNGEIGSEVVQRNAWESDKEDWQDKNKLNVPPGEGKYEMRYLGLGTQHFGEWDDDYYLFLDPFFDLVDDSEKMKAYEKE